MTEPSSSFDPLAHLPRLVAARTRHHIARVAEVVCLAALTLPPSASIPQVDEQAREWLSTRAEYDPRASGDPRAQQWLAIEARQHERGDRRNAVVARACAITFSLPRHGQYEHPLGQGVDRAELAVGAAGGYYLTVSIQPLLTAVRIYLDLE